jgi:hypothetical protein
MIKTLLITFTTVLFFGHCFGQTSLFERTWAYNERTMHLIDSAASVVHKQKVFFHRKKAKLKSVSPDNRKIKHKTKIRYRNGNTIVREKYRIGSECRIRVLSINGQVQMVRSEFYKKGWGGDTESIFVNLGNKTWQWTYLTYGPDLKIYKTETVRNWR